ncbi:GNAT family N-acetyltransferase [Solirubrobacter taibaiensis]|nr:GNAT family N-acetyltransferase [Solirubrobacter taibaiensis]
MLRSATPEDLEALVALARHPEIARTLATNAVDSLRDDVGELLAIHHDGALAGGVRWTLVNRRSRVADIRTLMIDPRFAGQGLAARAVKLLVRQLVLDHDVHRVEAETYGFNDAAQRVFTRAGFTNEGVRRQAYDRHGAWQDGVRFGLLSHELADV